MVSRVWKTRRPLACAVAVYIAAWLGCSRSEEPPQPPVEVVEESAPRVSEPERSPEVPRVLAQPESMDGPALPDLSDWDCPGGWGASSPWSGAEGASEAVAKRLGFRVCRPPELPAECAPGSMPVLGNGSCVPQGLECPEYDAWHDEATIRRRAAGFDGKVVYVSPAGHEDGEGTRESPFGSIEDAADWAEDGDILALSKGTFSAEIFLQDEFALVGACEAQTLLTVASLDDSDAVVNVDVLGPVTLSDLRISGGTRGIGVLATRLLRVVGVSLHQTTGAALWISPVEQSVEVSLEDVVISDTQPDAESGLGVGVEINAGGLVTMRRTVVERSQHGAVYVDGKRSILRAVDSVIRRTQSTDASDIASWAVMVTGGGRVELDRVWVGDNEDLGVYVDGEHSELVLTDVVIANTAPASDGAGLARGLSMHGGARAVAEHLLVDSNRGLAVLVSGAGTSARMDGLAVLGSRSQPGIASAGRGMQVQQGARVEASRALFHRNRDVGVLATGPGTVLELSDFAVSDTRPREAGVGRGRALEVSTGASGTIFRGILRNNREAGLAVLGAEATASVRDLRVRATRESPCPSASCPPPGGSGIVVSDGALLELEDFEVSGSDLAGLQLAGAGGLRARSGVLRQNRIGFSGPEAGAPEPGTVRAVANDLGREPGNLPLPSSSDSIEFTTSAE